MSVCRCTHKCVCACVLIRKESGKREAKEEEGVIDLDVHIQC